MNFDDTIHDIAAEVQPLFGQGRVADYIPELGKVAPAGVDTKRFEDNNATIAAFVAGQVQFVALGASVAGNMMTKNPQLSSEYKLLLKESPNFIGVAKGEDKLKAKVNEIVAEAKKTGELDALAKKWLGRPAGGLPL